LCATSELGIKSKPKNFGQHLNGMGSSTAQSLT
jgi:hypothetical protein